MRQLPPGTSTRSRSRRQSRARVGRDPEPDVGVDRARQQGPAGRAAERVWPVDVRAAAHDARLGGVVSRRIGRVRARHPLGHVPGQVERPARRSACRQLPGDRRARRCRPRTRPWCGRAARHPRARGARRRRSPQPPTRPRSEASLRPTRRMRPRRARRRTSRARVLPGGTVPSGHELGGRCPVSRTNAAYCAFVTGIRPIRNGATSTTCRGLSSAAGG